MKETDMDPLLKDALRGTQPTSASACVQAETLAAWSAGSLPAHEASEVDRHLATCARCQAMLATFARALPQAAVVVPFWRRRQIRWLVPIAAAAAASVAIWIALPDRGRVPAAIDSVARVEPVESPVTQPAAPTPTPPATSAPNSSGGAGAVQRQDSPGVVLPSQQKELTAAPVEAPPPPPTAAPLTSAPPQAAAAPPAPAPAPPRADVQGAARVLSAAAPAAESTRAAIEIVPPQTGGNLVQPFATAGRGGAAGGRGGAGAGRGGALSGTVSGAAPILDVASALAASVKWRILPTGTVERTVNGGGSWQPVSIDPTATLTGGAAASSTICWLVGRGGAVFRTVDGVRFERLTFPVSADLRSIQATGAATATVVTTDGRTFTTSDGGLTWMQGF